jgi:hypothetical protein
MKIRRGNAPRWVSAVYRGPFVGPHQRTPFEKPLSSAAKGSRGGTAAHRACKRTTQIGSCTERPIRILAVIACMKNLQKVDAGQRAPGAGGLKISVSDGFRALRLRVRTQDPVSHGRDTEAERELAAQYNIKGITTLMLFDRGSNCSPWTSKSWSLVSRSRSASGC